MASNIDASTLPPQMISKIPSYGLLAIITMTAGLASRQYADALPSFLAEYLGDTLWAMMVFWGFCMLLPHFSVSLRGILAGVFSFTIECSQLYHAPWIDSIRQTRLGGLVLGHGFLWIDFVCYSVGILIGVVVAISAENFLCTPSAIRNSD